MNSIFLEAERGAQRRIRRAEVRHGEDLLVVQRVMQVVVQVHGGTAVESCRLLRVWRRRRLLRRLLPRIKTEPLPC